MERINSDILTRFRSISGYFPIKNTRNKRGTLNPVKVETITWYIKLASKIKKIVSIGEVLDDLTGRLKESDLKSILGGRDDMYELTIKRRDTPVNCLPIPRNCSEMVTLFYLFAEVSVAARKCLHYLRHESFELKGRKIKMFNLKSITDEIDCNQCKAFDVDEGTKEIDAIIATFDTKDEVETAQIDYDKIEEKLPMASTSDVPTKDAEVLYPSVPLLPELDVNFTEEVIEKVKPKEMETVLRMDNLWNTSVKDAVPTFGNFKGKLSQKVERCIKSLISDQNSGLYGVHPLSVLSQIGNPMLLKDFGEESEEDLLRQTIKSLFLTRQLDIIFSQKDFSQEKYCKSNEVTNEMYENLTSMIHSIAVTPNSFSARLDGIERDIKSINLSIKSKGQTSWNQTVIKPSVSTPMTLSNIETTVQNPIERELRSEYPWMPDKYIDFYTKVNAHPSSEDIRVLKEMTENN